MQELVRAVNILLRLIYDVMYILDSHKTNGRHIAMDNVSTHKVSEISRLIVVRRYKPVYLSPSSLSSNPIKLLWSKLKVGVKIRCLSSADNLSSGIVESAKQVTLEDYHDWIRCSVPLFDRRLTLKHTL